MSIEIGKNQATLAKGSGQRGGDYLINVEF